MRSRVMGVLAGDRTRPEWLSPWLRSAEVILAADAGADLVRLSGFVPDVLIGDLDSVSDLARATAKKVVEVVDQDFSDCEKLLDYASSEGIDELLLTGLEGSRIDHTLHALSSVAKWQGSCLVAFESILGRLVRSGQELHIEGEGLLSVIPILPSSGVSIDGVKWPLAEVEMAPAGFASVSNQNLGLARVTVRSGVVLATWQYDGAPAWDL